MELVLGQDRDPVFGLDHIEYRRLSRLPGNSCQNKHFPGTGATLL